MKLFERRHFLAHTCFDCVSPRKRHLRFSLISVNAIAAAAADKESVNGDSATVPKRRLASPLYAGGNQPARRSFGIAEVEVGAERLPVLTRDAAKQPFYKLAEFTAPDVNAKTAILIVAPLSGHFAILARDLIAGLLPNFRMFITDWINVRHVPPRYGTFCFAKNISSICDIIKKLDGGLTVIGLCQGGIPALAATALLAAEGDEKTPANLILMGSPIDPLTNPTKVVQLLRERPLSWFEENLIAAVSEGYTGHGRRVYPAQLHLLPLWTYLMRHVSEGTVTGRKVLLDDGEDPIRFPFLDLFTSIMDLDAAYFLENTQYVFHDPLFLGRELSVNGACTDLREIRTPALLTIEGESDDICAPGQTSAAHRLCSSIPKHRRRSLVVPGAGHFSLFYGNTWRSTVLPAIREFCGSQAPALRGASRSLIPAG
jgi:poly(3-hydroxybutyrate) depolymerase